MPRSAEAERIPSSEHQLPQQDPPPYRDSDRESESAPMHSPHRTRSCFCSRSSGASSHDSQWSSEENDRSERRQSHTRHNGSVPTGHSRHCRHHRSRHHSSSRSPLPQTYLPYLCGYCGSVLWLPCHYAPDWDQMLVCSVRSDRIRPFYLPAPSGLTDRPLSASSVPIQPREKSPKAAEQHPHCLLLQLHKLLLQYSQLMEGARY